MSELAESNISCVNDVFIKQIRFRHAGDMMVTHAHVYDHQTLLASGSVDISVDGVVMQYTAPAIIVIAAGKHHALQATCDETVAYCIHAIRGGDSVDNAEPLVMGHENDEVHQVTIGEV